MKITAILNEQELNQAVMKFVTDSGYSVEGMDVKITMKHGRKGNGTYANITFSPQGSELDDDSLDIDDESNDNDESSASAESQQMAEGSPVIAPQQDTEDLKQSLFN